MQGSKGVLQIFRKFTKSVQKSDVIIDNIVFKLHYRCTVFLLFGASVIVSLQQYFGDHINCITDSGLAKAFINTFCFFKSTFTVVKHYTESDLQDEVIPHPGVGPVAEEDEIIRHAYYQWVPFMLFLQGVMFYIPHFIWKYLEGGRLRMLVLHLKYASFASDFDVQVDKFNIPSKEKRQKNLKQVQDAFYHRLHINRPWASSLVFCEMLNAINLCIQIFLLDVFFGGSFMKLGVKIAGADFSKEADPLEYIFPKVTKCMFHKYGPSGTIQNHDALCVMGLNVINEKIYTFFWFWLALLTIATALGLLWRLLALLLHSRSETFNALVFRATCPQTLDPWELVKVTDECHFSDWLFLHYLGKNLDDNIFQELFLGLASQITENSKPDRFYLRGDETRPLNGE